MNIVQPIREVENLEKIIEYLKSNHQSCAVAFIIGIYSGLRVSDIINLNICDVKDKDDIVVKEKKTKKTKKFPIKNQVKEILSEYLRFRYDEGAISSSPLIVGAKGERIHRSIIYRAINEACHNVGLQGQFGTHTMRKTFGYHHYKQNNDVVLLQKIFNHSTPSVTLRYIGIDQEEINQSYVDFEYCEIDEIQNIKKVKKDNSNKDINKLFSELRIMNKRIDKLLELYLNLSRIIV